MHAKITHTSGIIMYILANDFFSSNDTIVFFVFCFFFSSLSVLRPRNDLLLENVPYCDKPREKS